MLHGHMSTTTLEAKVGDIEDVEPSQIQEIRVHNPWCYEPCPPVSAYGLLLRDVKFPEYPSSLAHP